MGSTPSVERNFVVSYYTYEQMMQFARDIGLDMNAQGSDYILRQLMDAYVAGTPIEQLQPTADAVSAPPAYSGDLRDFTLGGQTIGSMLDSGQAFITPPGSDASYYYIPDSGPVMTGYTPEQREEIENAQQDARTRGIGTVAALVGGGAALGATPWGSVSPSASGAGLSEIALPASVAPTGAIASGLGPSIPAAQVAAGTGAAAGLAMGPGTPAAIAGAVPAAADALASGSTQNTGSLPGGVGNAAGFDWASIVPAIVSGVTGVLGANAQADAANDAARLSREMFDIARADALPRINTGNAAIGVLDDYLGLTSGTPNPSRFTTSPSYQFDLSEGTKAGQRALSSMGLGRSGTMVKEAERFATGLASRNEGTFIDRLLATAGLGTTGAAQSAAAGATNASIGGQAITNRGAARSSGYGAVNDAVQGGIGNYLLQQYLKRNPVYA